jgi:hypothetical protein
MCNKNMAASQNASAAVANKPELIALVAAAAAQFYCNRVNFNSRTWPNAKGRKKSWNLTDDDFLSLQVLSNET